MLENWALEFGDFAGICIRLGYYLVSYRHLEFCKSFLSIEIQIAFWINQILPWGTDTALPAYLLFALSLGFSHLRYTMV